MIIFDRHCFFSVNGVSGRFSSMSEKFDVSVSAANQVASWPKLNQLLLMYYHILPSKLRKRRGKVLKYLVEFTAKH